LTKTLLNIPKEVEYPYRQEKKLGKLNYLNLIPHNLQGVYVNVAVTFEMFFYGESNRRNCPACLTQIERYSHIQWQCKKIIPRVNEEELVRVIKFRAH